MRSCGSSRIRWATETVEGTRVLEPVCDKESFLLHSLVLSMAGLFLGRTDQVLGVVSGNEENGQRSSQAWAEKASHAFSNSSSQKIAAAIYTGR